MRKPNQVPPALSAGIAGLLAPAPSPPSILFSCGCHLIMDRECYWGAPHASLLFEAGDADVASVPAFAFFAGKSSEACC